jgi:hypothetical protein
MLCFITIISITHKMKRMSEAREVSDAIRQAIADLKATGIAVPRALHQAVHALSDALAERSDRHVIPFKREPRR